MSGIPPVAVVLGTRPEIIKLAPVIRELGPLADVVFTGQHYDAQLTEVFFTSCGVPQPTVAVPHVGGASRAQQMVRMLNGLVDRFTATRPEVVVVQGDTNSANAGAQAAHYLGIPVVHVEAGLRSYDPAMPEEINRMVIGSLADVHCCATPGNAETLRRAGIRPTGIHVTGNTIVEATRRALPDAVAVTRLLEAYGVRPGRFVLATVHRPENTDDAERLTVLLDRLGALDVPVLFPLHPRTRAALDRHGVEPRGSVRLVDPVDHPEFLALASTARLIVSDSGGVQEEVTVLRRPLVVVRTTTERPEAVAAGFARLAEPAGIAAAAAELLRPSHLAALKRTESPFGDGLAHRRIAALIRPLAGAPAHPSERALVGV